jgi:GYF domain 2
MPEIYLHVNGQQAGPYQPDQVRQLLAEGKVSGDTPAWHQELANWSTVAQVLPHFFPAPTVPPPFVPPAPLPPLPTARKGLSGCMIAAIIVGCLGVLLLPCCAGIALGPINAGIKKAQENMSMQQARQIALAMSAYASDHNGAYPDGKTSTEVFQKLIDQTYISDPGIFYVAMPGKTKATSSALSADNVSFDVTSGVTADSSDYVPVVFCTGYRVIYEAGASAARDGSSATPFPGPGRGLAGVAVAYKNSSARFLNADVRGTVTAFIPSTFDPGTKDYQQLRP